MNALFPAPGYQNHVRMNFSNQIENRILISQLRKKNRVLTGVLLPSNQKIENSFLSMEKEIAYAISPSMALFLHLPLKKYTRVRDQVKIQLMG